MTFFDLWFFLVLFAHFFFFFWNPHSFSLSHSLSLSLSLSSHSLILSHSLGMSVTDEELEEKFKKADANSDKKITAEELANFFQGRTFEIAAAYSAASGHERKHEREAEAIFDMADVDQKNENDAYVIGKSSKKEKSHVFGFINF